MSPRSPMPQRRLRARGIALIAVLWVVAIMSVITVGLVQSVRSEIKTTALERQRLQAQALGEAAIALAAQQADLLAQEHPDQGVFELNVQYGGISIPVRIQGLHGFVNLTSAPPELLALLLERIGGLNGAAAQELAARIVQWRDEPTSSGIARGIEAPEDLLQVPGMHYALYARVADFVTASLRYGNLDLRSSPAPLRALFGLQSGDAAPGGAQRMERIQLFFRFTALVPQESTTFELTRDMRVSHFAQRSGLYWQVLDSRIRVANADATAP
ncbi:general secretion pathway protein GspK [Vandammella animalimorsus]|uniref:General secretion pathway protein GspK n=2 Tax=Vandammella animalimorsus TaxID=2029117 RepID=A0A2A2AN12_9BURK|nr:general secretion pathway protein GspK [Vandammella animalimorsus]